MMKLKNLVIDTHMAASQSLRYWDYDDKSVRFWRGSANFVYYFTYNNKGFFLRLSHEEENSIEQIVAELEYLKYLKHNNYASNAPIKSKMGNDFEEIKTNLGTYYAVVFNGVQGRELDLEQMSELQLQDWGEALGQLHILSSGFVPKENSRRSWEDILLFVGGVLKEFPSEESAVQELERIHRWLASLPKNRHNFGLIHYDFEADNVFWDDNENTYTPIDFDDTMYHWYVMDIVNALQDFLDKGDAVSKAAIKAFLRGYSKIREIDKDLMDELERFQRFGQLYSFARLLRSLKDSDFDEDPDWLKVVRPKLLSKICRLRKGFNKSW